MRTFVTLQQGVQGDAVHLPEREVSSLPLYFSRAPPAARKGCLNSYEHLLRREIHVMNATDLAIAAIRAWESKDADSLDSYLSDDFVCRGLLPQPAQKAQYIDFMQAIMTAMPDWSFHEHLLDEGPVTVKGERVFFVTQITATHTGDLILPDLPIIPPTGIKISLPYRHLEYFVKGETITAITADFSPNALEEILAQMGMVLPS